MVSVSSGIRVGGVSADAEDVISDLGFVDRVFLYVWRICPFAVSLLSGRYFCTRSTVRPGQVAKKFRFMAAIHVRFGGHKQH